MNIPVSNSQFLLIQSHFLVQTAKSWGLVELVGYAQICDENALIWDFPRRIFRPPPTWNFDDVNNQYSYSYSSIAIHTVIVTAGTFEEIIHGSRRFVLI
jgi:hypothetical protein